MKKKVKKVEIFIGNVKIGELTPCDFTPKRETLFDRLTPQIKRDVK